VTGFEPAIPCLQSRTLKNQMLCSVLLTRQIELIFALPVLPKWYRVGSGCRLKREAS
jgi:hypothetical protein